MQPNLFDPVPLPVIPARSTDPDTSHHAATLGRMRRGSIRALLAVAYAEWPRVLTDHQAAHAAGLDFAAGTWKRCSELRSAGYIVDTGERVTGMDGAPVMVCRMPSEIAAEILRHDTAEK